MLEDITKRIEKYFDNIYIDEIQDFSGYDFNLIINLIKCNCNIFLVGDFYQHTYDTSRDGLVNKNLYNNYETYINKFKTSTSNLIIDKNNFSKSKRCSKEVCDFIKKTLNIEIESYFNKSSNVIEIKEKNDIDKIIKDNSIVKLFYQNSKKYNIENKDNWGNSKGETYFDVCVILNKNSYENYKKKSLSQLPMTTKNKLYVACSRPTNNLYLISETLLKEYLK